MRLFTISLLSAIALVRSCSAGGSRHIEKSTAERFRDAIGVNVHLQYGNTAYHDEQQVAKALDYLGISHVRDGALRRGEDAFGNYVNLARHGIRFDLFFNADLGPQLNRVGRLERLSPGAIDLLEGPNEINNDPVMFAGRSGVAAGRAYQAALYARAKADPALASLPVLNYTNWPPTGGRADAVNAHTYAKPGVDTRSQISKDVELAAAALPSGLARYITETGYPTGTKGHSEPWLNPSEQADLTIIALLEAFRLGIRRTYIYELFDEGDAQSIDPERHYGLFDAMGTPKDAAKALHTLQVCLLQLDRETSSRARAVTVDVKGENSLFLTGRSGDSLLFVWSLPQPALLSSVSLSRRQAVSEVTLDGRQGSSANTRRTWAEMPGRRLRLYILRNDVDSRAAGCGSQTSNALSSNREDLIESHLSAKPF